jgi:enoyl-CoA hydratase
MPMLPGRGFARITRAVVRKPLIAAVEGWAVGGGFEIALACDLIVAAEIARFGFSEVKWGLVAGGGGLIRLPTRIPITPPSGSCSSVTRCRRRRRSSTGRSARWPHPGLRLGRRRSWPDTSAERASGARGRHADPAHDTRARRRRRLRAPDHVRAGRERGRRQGRAAFAEKHAPVWHAR